MNVQEKKKRNELFKLMQENPDLPVVPMVDSEIVADNCCTWWCGSWGKSRVGKYCISEERIWFDDDDIEDVLNDFLGYGAWEDMTDKEAQEAFDNLPWEEAIIVYIEMPK